MKGPGSGVWIFVTYVQGLVDRTAGGGKPARSRSAAAWHTWTGFESGPELCKVFDILLVHFLFACIRLSGSYPQDC